MAQKEFRPFWSERYWNIHNWRDTGTLQEADTRWNLWRYADAIDSIVAFRHCAYGFLPLTFDSSQDVHSQALLGFHMFLCCIGVSMHICFCEESVFCVSGRISCCVFSCFVKLVSNLSVANLKSVNFVFCQFQGFSVSNWFLAARAQVRRRPWIRKPFYISRQVYLHESTRVYTDSTKIPRQKTAFAWHFDDCEIWDHVRSIGTVGIAGRWICRSAFLIPWALFRSWVRCNISYCDFYFVQCHQDKFMFFLIFYT